MKIKGKYNVDDNFVNIYVKGNPDTLYTIARNTGDWASVQVGHVKPHGRFTQDVFDKGEAECNECGTFTLED